MVKNVKMFALKQQSAVALRTPGKAEKARSNSGSIRDSVRGWLHVVAPSSISIARPITRLPKLTATDIVRVNHATIREGESHRVWPPSILRKFNSAEVITKTKTKHYELRDVNLTRVG
jgi:hypothetical protein